MQTQLLQRIVQQQFKLTVEPIFKRLQFLELNLEEILNVSLNSFKVFTQSMTHKVSR